MKKHFNLEQLMDDWIIPLAILGAVIWFAIWVSGGWKQKTQEAIEATPTPEPVIVCMIG